MAIRKNSKIVVIPQSELSELKAELRRVKKPNYICVNKTTYRKDISELNAFRAKLASLNLLENSNGDMTACKKEELVAMFVEKISKLLAKHEKRLYDDYQHMDVYCIPPDEYKKLKDELLSTIEKDL
jgi:hypothetical protein